MQFQPLDVSVLVLFVGAVVALAYGKFINQRQRHEWETEWPAWSSFGEMLDRDDDGSLFEKHVLRYFNVLGFRNSERTDGKRPDGAPPSGGDYGADIIVKRGRKPYAAIECKNRAEAMPIDWVCAAFTGRTLWECPRVKLYYAHEKPSKPAEWAASNLDVELVDRDAYRREVDRLAPPTSGIATFLPRGRARAVQQWIASTAVVVAAAVLIVAMNHLPQSSAAIIR